MLLLDVLPLLGSAGVLPLLLPLRLPDVEEGFEGETGVFSCSSRSSTSKPECKADRSWKLGGGRSTMLFLSSMKYGPLVIEVAALVALLLLLQQHEANNKGSLSDLGGDGC
jgi:hypothetical protein